MSDHGPKRSNHKIDTRPVAFTVYLNDGTVRKYPKGYYWDLGKTARALQIRDEEHDLIALFNDWHSVEDKGHGMTMGENKEEPLKEMD